MLRPQVNIRKVRNRFFNYSVSTLGGAEHYLRQGLRSITECLHDAATALGPHFEEACISYEGLQMGVWSIRSMEHDSIGVSSLINNRLEKVGKAA